MNKIVSIIFVNYKTKDLTINAINSVIKKIEEIEYEILYNIWANNIVKILFFEFIVFTICAFYNLSFISKDLWLFIALTIVWVSKKIFTISTRRVINEKNYING